MNDEAVKKQEVIILNKTDSFGQLTPNNYEPFPKNPDIARIFTQIGHSEELGTGIPNVYKYTKPYSGNDNIIFNEEDIFLTEIPLKKFNNDTVNDTVNNRQEQIIKLIGKKKNTTINELSVILKVTRLTIVRDLNILKKLKLIKRIGSDKTGHWVIIK